MAPEKVRVHLPAHRRRIRPERALSGRNHLLAAAAAQIVGRPVKLVCSRADMYSFLGYQPASRRRWRSPPTLQGGLALCTTSDQPDDRLRRFPRVSRPKRRARCMPRPAMRRAACGAGQRGDADRDAGPRGGSGAVGAGKRRWTNSPIASASIRSTSVWTNYAEEDPRRPALVVEEAAGSLRGGRTAFGWGERPRSPQRDGDWRIGQGMASCTMGAFRNPPGRRRAARADGTAVVETGPRTSAPARSHFPADRRRRASTSPGWTSALS